MWTVLPFVICQIGSEKVFLCTVLRIPVLFESFLTVLWDICVSFVSKLGLWLPSRNIFKNNLDFTKTFKYREAPLHWGFLRFPGQKSGLNLHCLPSAKFYFVLFMSSFLPQKLSLCFPVMCFLSFQTLTCWLSSLDLRRSMSICKISPVSLNMKLNLLYRDMHWYWGWLFRIF